MYTYFISKKYTFFSKIIACAMIWSNQSTLYSMELNTPDLSKKSLELEDLYKHFINHILPSYINSDAPANLVFVNEFDSTVSETEPSTRRTLNMLECIKSLSKGLSAVNTYSYRILKPIYVAYIGRVFNTCCYDKLFYERDQKFCNYYNVNYFKKRPCLKLVIECAHALSLENNLPNRTTRILVDLTAYAEATFYVNHLEKIIVGGMGTFYVESTTVRRNIDHLDKINKSHIYQNRLMHLIKENNPKLLIFFKKVFDFTPHKDYTFVIGMEESLTSLPKDFYFTCKKEGFLVKLSDRYLLRANKDIKTTPLEDQYESFHSLEVSLLK